MRAFKFLARGAVGPFSSFLWPAPGTWTEVEGPLGLCSRGVHVCRPQDLAYWLHDELWEVETSGEALEGIDCLLVRRARLLRRIDAWRTGGSTRFAEACVEHARALAGSTENAAVRDLLADALGAAQAGYPAVSAYTAALVVSKLHGEPAYRAERVWQAEWIVAELV
jgi:hypothetical protein